MPNKSGLCVRCETPTPAMRGNSYCYAHKKAVKRKSMLRHCNDPCSKCGIRAKAVGHVWCKVCSVGLKACSGCDAVILASRQWCPRCARLNDAWWIFGRVQSRAERLAARIDHILERNRQRTSPWYQWAQRRARRLHSKRYYRGEWRQWARIRSLNVHRRAPPSQKVQGCSSDRYSRIMPWRSFARTAIRQILQRQRFRDKGEWYAWGHDKFLRLNLRRRRTGRISAMVTIREIEAIIREQDCKCALTGVPLTPKVAQLDHKIPFSKGGSDTKENLQAVHKVANRMKGNMSNAELVEWCKLIVAHA